MSGNLFIIIILLVITSSSLSTDIPPGDVYGLWTAANSPYIILGDITIPNDSTLTIEPGVLVEFQDHYALNVLGRLLAVGTESDSIVFTVNDTTGFSNPDTALGGWYGIRIVDTPTQNDSTKIVFCKLQYGKAVGAVWHLNAGGAICIINFDKVRISHCLFTNNSAGGLASEVPAGGAIHLAWSDIIIEGSTFSNNRALVGGGMQCHESNPILTSNTFANNHANEGGAISMGGTSSSVFTNNTFRHNFANNGGGMALGGGTLVKFYNDYFIDNSASDRGGGMMCWDPSLITLTNVTFAGNSANWGAGFGIVDGEASLDNCDFTENSAAWLGGALAADFVTLKTTNCTFTQDSSSTGGAIHSWFCDLQASHCTFLENSADGDGGGINSESSTLQIDSSAFSGNTASNGGGLRIRNCNLTIDSCLIFQNEAFIGGGGLQYIADTLDFSSQYLLELTHTRIVENTATLLVGGVKIDQNDSDSSLVNVLIDHCEFIKNHSDHVTALRIWGDIADFTISNSIFKENRASRWAAGATFRSNCSGSVYNCLFISNRAALDGGGASGGGVGVAYYASVDFMNCTFAYNSAGFGAGLYLRDAGIATVTNSIFWGNFPDQISMSKLDTIPCELTINYCDVQDGQDSVKVDSIDTLNWGIGNIDQDPLFMDSGKDDYHLQDSSPCIGSGIDQIEIEGSWYYSPVTDIEGNVRPDPDGSLPDMGAYESPLGPVGLTETQATNIPGKYALFQNYPNPFNPTTTISFDLPKASQVTLEIFNILGEKVTTLLSEKLTAGKYKYNWDASGLTSGMYFYKITADNFSMTRKMLLIQ